MDIILKEITKSFGQNRVLRGVNLHIRPGEIHALMGENGAGKSTMMNILTGLLKADSGTIIVDGQEVVYKNNLEAEQHGITFIHQELNIWQNLTVLENLFMLKQPKNRFGLIDFKKNIQANQQLNLHLQLFHLLECSFHFGCGSQI